MPVTSQGHITITSMVARANTELSTLMSLASNELYEGVPSRGWGSLVDGREEMLSRPSRERINPSRPDVVDPSNNYPSQLRLRLYWDELDKRLFEVSQPGDDESRYYRFDATDVIVCESKTDEFLILVSTRNPKQLKNFAIPALRDLFQAADSGSQLTVDSSPLAFQNDDIFRWFIHRTATAPDLSDEISLVAVDSINSLDTLKRVSALTQGADLDRPELLALLANSSTSFGPGKILVADHVLALGIGLELRMDGSFSVLRGESDYEDERGLSAAEKGIRLVLDATFRVIPELQRLYNADSSWRSVERAASIASARRKLNEIRFSD